MRNVAHNHVRLCVDYVCGEGFTASISVEGMLIECEADSIEQAVASATDAFKRVKEMK